MTPIVRRQGRWRAGLARKERTVAEYRSFRNTDPPSLVEIWNDAFPSRGAVRLRHSAPLERFTFAKPYFDPDGLIVAVEGTERVGFVHAGFGPNADESGISYEKGILCALGVRAAYRQRDIGTELLRRAEAYLRGRGARALYAGPRWPLCPFYFGLYGGCDMPGFLDSDPAAAPFLQAHGYRPVHTCPVMHRRLDRGISLADARFALLRTRYEIQVVPRSGAATWWRECVNGPLEFLEFRLAERGTGQVAARTEVWEMEGFGWSWGLPVVGIRDAWVEEPMRRQGLAKFLVAHVLRYMQDQYFGLVEIQTPETNEAARGLCRSLGFEQVDIGRFFQHEATPA